jgi:hypothetical protein
LSKSLNLWREKLVLEIELVHHVADNAGETFALHDRE